MMNLEKIGFYTLSDSRAEQASSTSPLWRCELLLTDRCNFRCPYCRGVKPEYRGDMPYDRAEAVLRSWLSQGLKNVRFSGGEPTLYPGLEKLVGMAQRGGCSRIAVSTNGSADFQVYESLVQQGVNDFSISLDACCSSVGDTMSGVTHAWEQVINNIRSISKIAYTTVGVVLTDKNIETVAGIVELADSLGVSDIRVIPSAQSNSSLKNFTVNNEILNKYPILKYRINNLREGKTVRGLSISDNHRCPLVLDDMAVIGNHHYPCIIYLREQGSQIGEFTTIEDVRKAREAWFQVHDCYADDICRNNCLDVCRDYNNQWLVTRDKT
jgi:MoaA/NifB/PqqE/SkfB family radical SAM enzyme